MRGTWAAGVAVAGLVLVGAVYGLIWLLVPDRGVARDWYIYGPLLLGPYALAAAGAWLSAPVRWTRIAARALGLAVCLGGATILGVAITDAWPVFADGEPVVVPLAGFMGAVVLIGQYWAGLTAAGIGVGGWALGGGAPDSSQRAD